MAEGAVYGARRMRDAGVADDVDELAWMEVFRKASVTYRDICSSTSYLALAPPEKRRECFELLGFSPEIRKFSEWSVVNGLRPLARHMSWVPNSTMQYMYGTGEFLAMVPGIVEDFRCVHPCQYLHMDERIGPKTMVGLSLHERVSLDVKEEETVEVVVEDVVEHENQREEKFETEKKVDVENSQHEHSAVSTYLSVFKPEIREEAVQACGLGPLLSEVVTAKFPMEEIGKLRGLTFQFRGKSPEVEVFGDRVVRNVGTEGVHVTLKRGEKGRRYTFLQVLQVMCKKDERVRRVRMEYDGVDYVALPVEQVEPPDLAVIEDLVWDEPFLDSVVERPLSSMVRILLKSQEHVCAKYGFMHAVVVDLQERLSDVVQVDDGIGVYLRFVGSRLIDWSCECKDRPKSVFRTVVFVRYKGSGLDKVIDKVWYGVVKAGHEPEYFCLESVVSLHDMPKIGMLGLLESRVVFGWQLPEHILQDAEDMMDMSHVRLEYDRDWLANGKGYVDSGGMYVDLDGCVCGMLHVID